MEFLCIFLMFIIFLLISSSSDKREQQKDEMLDLMLENDSLRSNPFYEREKILGFTRQDIIMLHDFCKIKGYSAKDLVEKIEHLEKTGVV